MNDRLILIETSTSLCSAGLAENGKTVAYRQSDVPRAHASMTAVYVQEILSGRGLRVSDCQAVCVSAGPGSYTGLRVGSSTAKGLCFGAGVPLIAVGTLETFAAQAIKDGLLPAGCRYIIPMIDARRMEVYTAVFDNTGRRLTDTESRIIDGGSFADRLAEGPVLFIGDGAEKCRGTIVSDNAHFEQCCPRADAMLAPAMQALKEKRFQDIAYFEPFYLKDFVATVSRRKLF